MVRLKDPAIRTLLIERAAHMLRVREPITLRTLVAGTGVSTMAVYTYFGGMDGLWRAMRQEGFTRLAAVLNQVAPSADPVRDLAALGAAYLANALANPDLYRVMFDPGDTLDDADSAGFTPVNPATPDVAREEPATVDIASDNPAAASIALENPATAGITPGKPTTAGFALEDPAAADEALHSLVRTAERAKAAGRFRDDVDALSLATQTWAIGHGLVSLVATGPLPREALDHGVPILTALFVSCGDSPEACRRSVTEGWTAIRGTAEPV
ncbi:TetR-like C-terminal domain-containing protein [Actinoplanes sp. NPDC023801]|uniref:TetR/AcrR family transcriptional regulator n=1 Tax=Actinoplanes sp. NPDC023801 TaxID=3154595 RepID=UPI0033FBEFC3